ncbi:MAG: hypothetical protein HY746_04345 [Elusimicrobia bacterium]|nr:hypothetical protein [Elusimicrobiota bacterium]
MKRKKVVMARIVKLSESNDNWDIKFWQRCGAQTRFSAAWKCIDEYYKFKGKNGVQPRLQRSVQNIEQIQG